MAPMPPLGCGAAATIDPYRLTRSFFGVILALPFDANFILSHTRRDVQTSAKVLLIWRNVRNLRFWCTRAVAYIPPFGLLDTM